MIHPARSGLIVEHQTKGVISDKTTISKISPTISKPINRKSWDVAMKDAGSQSFHEFSSLKARG